MDQRDPNNISGRIKKGKGTLQWMALVNTGVNLNDMNSSLMCVTPEELSKHNKVDDCWISLNGSVYNVTKYAEYHPGGVDELMRAAGSDGTKLFNTYHSFVNYERMLKPCYIGKLSGITNNTLGIGLTTYTKDLSKLKSKNIDVSWKFKKGFLILKIKNRKINLFPEDLIIVIDKAKDICISIKVDVDKFQFYKYHKVENVGEISECICKGKTIKTYFKLTNKYNKIPIFKSTSQLFKNTNDFTDNYNMDCKIVVNKKLTKDVHLVVLRILSNVHFCVPLGGHVRLKFPDDDLSKPYTCIPKLLLGSNQIESDLVTPDRDNLLYFVIKDYGNPSFSSKICSGEIDDRILCLGPKLSLGFKLFKSKIVYMIAAGTGIAPMIRLILYYLKNNSKINLLVCAKTSDDIILRQQLECLRNNYTNFDSIKYVLSQETFDNYKGRITANIISSFLNIKSNSEEFEWHEMSLYVCGSESFNGHIKDLNINSNVQIEDVYYFSG